MVRDQTPWQSYQAQASFLKKWAKMSACKSTNPCNVGYDWAVIPQLSYYNNGKMNCCCKSPFDYNISYNDVEGYDQSRHRDDRKHPHFYMHIDLETKPCFMYSEEYRDCRRIRARFHQYFIQGELSDCSQWKTDHKNCTQWQDKKDRDAFVRLIDSERLRVRGRLRDHLGNDTWELRSSPPKEWNSELPDFIQKGYEGSFLKAKAHELKNGLPINEETSFWESTTRCSIS